MNNLEPKTMAIVRLVAMAISWISLLLVSQFGWEPLPFTDEQVTQGVLMIVTVGTSLWSWYKNNPVTQYGNEKENQGLKKVGTREEFKAGMLDANQPVEVNPEIIEEVTIEQASEDN